MVNHGRPRRAPPRPVWGHVRRRCPAKPLLANTKPAPNGKTLGEFLEEVGVTSQREIEKKARDALADGRLQGERLEVKVTFELATLG
jgi:hypothetical protein